MYPLLGGWSAACAVALQLVIMLYFHPSGLESSSDGGLYDRCFPSVTILILIFAPAELLQPGDSDSNPIYPTGNYSSPASLHPTPNRSGIPIHARLPRTGHQSPRQAHDLAITFKQSAQAMNIRPSPSIWGWPFPHWMTVPPGCRQTKTVQEEHMNNKPDVQQRDILTEATVGRAQTDFWLPPSSNAIGPESSRSATFKMPSTLLHLAWIRQLAVRWLNPPVVDALGRGAYTSPLTRAARLANLPPPCRGVEACDPWAPAGPEIYQGGLNGQITVTNPVRRNAGLVERTINQSCFGANMLEFFMRFISDGHWDSARFRPPLGHDYPLVGMCNLSGYLEGGEETLLKAPYSTSLSSESAFVGQRPDDDARKIKRNLRAAAWEDRKTSKQAGDKTLVLHANLTGHDMPNKVQEVMLESIGAIREAFKGKAYEEHMLLLDLYDSEIRNLDIIENELAQESEAGVQYGMGRGSRKALPHYRWATVGDILMAQCSPC
ncbi:hypothetical protein B0H13DRAFT_1850361 [Mycena leptocephala]|nr:hypothetical protein B0H13DRAFT_1850361 [Mycena leptocephala]